jgi:two-component system nitrogen regulation response regulator GlnG
MTLAARLDAPVLLEGPTGSGKEVVARELHRMGRHAQGPFVALNVVSLTPDMAPSVLFGHHKGAFTGAAARHRGVFEQAERGTLFLDEIGELPLSVQPILLRVLQDLKVTPLGGECSRRVRVAVVAATNRSLEQMVAAGTFRADLYYRLQGMRIIVPPLRGRVQDIRALVRYYLERSSRAMGLASVPRLSSSALAMLEDHTWPGNVRELVRCVERLAVNEELGSPIGRAGVAWGLDSSSMKWLPDDGLVAKATSAMGGPLRQALRDIEARAIASALERAGGNVTRTARLLGERPTTLRSRIDRLGIDLDAARAIEECHQGAT